MLKLNKNKKLFSIFLKGFFVFILLLYIFGFSPVKLIFATLKNIGSNPDHISFYSTNFSLNQELDDYLVGWWNASNALHAPDLNQDDTLLYFNDENSAFYSGGEYEIVFNNFLLPEEYNIEAQIDLSQGEVEIVEKQDMLDSVLLEENADLSIASSSSEEKVNASTSLDIFENSFFDEDLDIEEGEESSNISSTSPEVLGAFEELENDFDNEQKLGDFSPEVEVLDPSEDGEEQAVELIEIETPEILEPEVIEPEEADAPAEEGNLSFINFSNIALAQETEESGLNDFGKFRSATINLSLAYTSRNTFRDDSQNNDEVVEDNDTEEIEDEIETIEEENIEENPVSTSTDQEFDETGDAEDFNQSSDDELSVDDEMLEIPSAEAMEEDIIIEGIEESQTEEDPILEQIDEIEILEEESDKTLDDSVSFFNLVKEAKAQSGLEEKINIWYSVDLETSETASGTISKNIKWHKLKTIKAENYSNALNGAYLKLEADYIKNWENVENLAIKLEGVSEDDNDFVFYLDSLWLDVEYDRAKDAPEPEEEKLKRWEESLEFLSEKNVFGINEKGEFRFQYKKNSQKALEALGGFFGFINYWRDVDLNVSIVSNSGEEIVSALTMVFEDDGEFSIKLPDIGRTLEPGKYKIVFSIEDASGDRIEMINLTHEFSWGVLAFNTNKSVFFPKERAYLQMAVLDDFGHTICDAELSLQITDPDGRLLEFSTENNQISKSSECGPKSITNNPDYFLYYDLADTGDYEVKLIAKTKNGIKEIDEVIKVRKDSPLDVSRTAPSRIYPLSDYIMQINIIAKEDYLGDIREYLPRGFKLVSQEINIINSETRDPFSSEYKFETKDNPEETILNWQGVDLRAGDELLIKYMFDAPDISPEFYLLGPLETDIFSEVRKWQIASDAVSKRAKTVKFLAGVYNGGASAGQNSDTNQTFSSFTFRLAETGVEIKNAYVMFESLFEAYSNANIYTGYNLAFDSCLGACAPSAFSGTNRILQDDNSVLAYSETESNKIRLLLDVSAETQLASYVGEGATINAQVGYRLERGSAVSSIGNAKAVLYVTYLYDSDSENITNTVSYPLDSTNGTDTGTRQSSVGACTRNSTCPVFDYNMDIPEWTGTATSTNRVSQWFKMYDANDGNNANDIDANINIQTYDVDSVSYHHESQNAGTQGNLGAMFFDQWTSSGYAENTPQQLELYLNSGTNYVAGGEVFETYIASSSAAIKTRTVTFPIGVISNGNSTSLFSDSVNIYFPENGTGTGNVSVKSAYFRIITHNQNSAVLNVTVSTKVGANATSSNTVYAYNGGGSVIKPSYNIIHIIPNSNYAELEGANANTAKNVLINTTQNATTYGGISAELVVTYTYTDESNGYLTNINLYGGQSAVAPTTAVNLSTANSVMPESSGKTVLAGGLLSSYLNSDSGGVVGAGTVFLLDANLGTTTPTCTPAYRAEPDDMNSFSEFYKDVTLAMNTIDNQSYTACYSDDETLTTTDGAKMSGQFIYTYQWDNSPPSGLFNSLSQKTDGSKTVDISIEINDTDAQEIRAKLEYEATSTCAFISPLDPSLDETDANITADFGDPAIDNASIYQIGTPVSYIITASGTNSVLFDWTAPLGVEDTYCLRLTANDNMADQINPATSTVYIDTINPVSPGTLSLFSRTGTSLTLSFGATTTETNFKEYKIFYKITDGTDPDENDSVLASSTDINLGNKIFNGATTTIINSLTEKTTYSLAIWAYDNYGNRASSSRVDIYTNDAPTTSFNSSGQRTDGTGVVDISIEVDDANNDDTNIVRVDYVLGSTCDFTSPFDPSLDETQSNIYSDFGLPSIANTNIYQIATSGAYILTSPGANTIEFDWLTAGDEAIADATYCIRTIANDSYDDQIVVSTSTLVLDNVNPTTTGDLSITSVGLTSLTIAYATSSPASDTNEPATNAYKIFYKQGTSGVTESDAEHNNTDLDSYNYNTATSTTISGLLSDTDYVLNIWSYDIFGNKISATEITAKTNSTLVNESLIFTNATSSNIFLMDGTTEWNFRAKVSETDGWFALKEVILGLANKTDEISTFDDLRFKWSQSLQVFSEIGTDTNSAAVLSANSTSTCAVNDCTIDFKVIFNKTFASSSLNYDAELISTNDGAKIVDDFYTDFYQGRYIELEQTHYRWRNDDGGE